MYYFLEHDQILSELSREQISEITFIVHYTKNLKANYFYKILHDCACQITNQKTALTLNHSKQL